MLSRRFLTKGFVPAATVVSAGHQGLPWLTQQAGHKFTALRNNVGMFPENAGITAYYRGSGNINSDSMIHCKNANIVPTDDPVVNRHHPFIDGIAGASETGWVTVLQKARKQLYRNTLFIFGHAFAPDNVTGNLTNLAAMQNDLKRLLEFVKTSMKTGRSKGGISQGANISGWQGDGIKRSMSAAYKELTT